MRDILEYLNPDKIEGSANEEKATPSAPLPGPADRERILWLLEFLRLDPAVLKPGRLLDLRNDVFAYLHEATLATVTVHDDPDLRALKPARAVEADPIVILARHLMARVRRDLRTGVEALEKTGSWQPFGLTPDRPAPRWSLERRADGTVYRAYCGDWKTITLGSAAELLAQRWPELRRCAYAPCGVLFLPNEGRQKYHDPKRSALARWHRLPPRNHQKEKERRVLGNGPGRGRGRQKR